jgi:creatinine amidohydrolase
MARAEASPALRHEIPGPLTRSDPASPNYSRSGSFGDPTLATRAKGEILLAAMVDDMAEQATAFLAGKRKFPDRRNRKISR